MKTRKTLLIVILIMVTLTGALIKSSSGATGTYYPEHSTDDGFVTDIGAFFGTTGSLPLQSGTSDIQSGVRFQNVSIPQDAKINNATLFVRTLWTFDPGLAYATIYGVDENNAYGFNGSGDFTRPYTSAYVNWNVSDITGSSWHNVSVTNIVQEIISRYNWDSGNALALIILGTEGEIRREFASYDQNVAYRPRLEIYWDTPPTDPAIEDIQDQANPPYNDTDEWVFAWNGTYKGIDIYTCTGISYWFNFSTFTHIGGAPAPSGWNDTYFYLTNMYQDSSSYLRRDYDTYYDDSEPNINVKFGMTIVNLPFSVTTGYVTLWAVSDNHAPAFDYNKGFVFTIRTLGDSCLFYAWSMDASAMKDSLTWGMQIMESELPVTKYWDVSLNMQTYAVESNVYEDVDMNVLNGTWTDTFTAGPAWGDGSWLTYEWVNGATESAGTPTGYSGAHLSKVYDVDEFIFLVYPNGTLVTPDPLPDDVDIEDYIDEIVGIDPEDPQTDDYGTALTKNRWKMFVFVIGMVMFLGTPTIGIISKAGIGRWYMIIFVSLCGLALLWSLMYM